MEFSRPLVGSSLGKAHDLPLAMAIKKHTGFALLIAIIFVSVVLALSTTLSSLGYKQQLLASTAARSQYAFYAADALLECALIDGNKVALQDPYSYQNGPYIDDGSKPIPHCGSYNTHGSWPLTECFNTGACPNQRITKKLFEIAFSNPNDTNETPNTGTLCAELTVYESPNKPAGSTYMFAQGFDVPCSTVLSFRAGNTALRLVTQGLFVSL
jgi:hypothetical protein